jgi:hypothetical protein
LQAKQQLLQMMLNAKNQPKGEWWTNCLIF